MREGFTFTTWKKRMKGECVATFAPSTRLRCFIVRSSRVEKSTWRLWYYLQLDLSIDILSTASYVFPNAISLTLFILLKNRKPIETTTSRDNAASSILCIG
eukprot:scaffold149_cov179-Amphora_coffeaeformis.AAC.19